MYTQLVHYINMSTFMKNQRNIRNIKNGQRSVIKLKKTQIERERERERERQRERERLYICKINNIRKLILTHKHVSITCIYSFMPFRFLKCQRICIFSP